MTKECPTPNEQAALTTAPAAVWVELWALGLVIQLHCASRSTCAASFSKSISSPAAGNLCASKYQSSVKLTVPPGGMGLRGPWGSNSQAGTCSACGYQKQSVRPAISGYTPSFGDGNRFTNAWSCGMT